MDGSAAAIDTPIGRVPTPEALDVEGLDMSDDDLRGALSVNVEEWTKEIPLIEEWFEKVGPALPSTMRDELEALRLRLEA
jgi:phosphoenolpyruvate carboxykinase (GTP)